MKLRYRKDLTNGIYVPQYFKEEKWNDLKVENVAEPLKLIAQALADANNRSREQDGSTWYYRPVKGNDNSKSNVLFADELRVCAFLGALQQYYSNQGVNFNLKLETCEQ